MMVMMDGGDDDDDGDVTITAVVFGHCHQPGACVLAVPRFGMLPGLCLIVVQV